METRIRPAVARDLPGLTALARSTYADAYGQDMTTAALEKRLNTHLSLERMGEMVQRDTFLLAETGQGLIGFVQFGEARPDYRGDGGVSAGPDDQELRRLYVRADQQGRGLGGHLMDAALHHPRLAGRRVFLTVWHTNSGARRFYARFGFRRVGSFPDPAPDDGFDVLLLRAGPAS